MKQINFNCPHCQKDISIPFHELLKYFPSNKQSKINIISILLNIIGSVCLIATLLLSILLGKANRKNSILTNENQVLIEKIEEAQELIVNRLNEANQKIKEANKKNQASLREAEERVQEMETRTNAVVLQAQKRLHEKYANLHRFKRGINKVDEKYVESFELSGERLFIKMRNNDTYNSQKPNFTLFFLTEEGFLTGHKKVYWLFNSIAPGEIRTEDTTVILQFGEPTYYLIQFEN